MKNCRKHRFFKTSFKKNPRSRNFFENVFRQKGSIGSCATNSENMLSVSVLGFEKIASQV